MGRVTVFAFLWVVALGISGTPTMAEQSPWGSVLAGKALLRPKKVLAKLATRVGETDDQKNTRNIEQTPKASAQLNRAKVSATLADFLSAGQAVSFGQWKLHASQEYSDDLILWHSGANRALRLWHESNGWLDAQIGGVGYTLWSSGSKSLGQFYGDVSGASTALPTRELSKGTYTFGTWTLNVAGDVMEITNSGNAGRPTNTRIRRTSPQISHTGYSETTIFGVPTTVTKAGTLGSGDTILSDGTFADTYPLELFVGDVVQIGLVSSAFDAMVGVVDPAGAALVDDDSGGGLNAFLDFTVTLGGTWTVYAMSAAPATGAYTLMITVERAEDENQVVDPPVASFTSSVSTGVAPLTVQFTNTSTGTGNTYAWSFGDGGTGTTANSSHTYTSAGAYTVQLTATNAGGSHSTTRKITVTSPVTRLLARAIVGNSRAKTPQTVEAGTTLRFEVSTFTKADTSDLRTVTDFTWTVPARLGRATSLGQMSVATAAGVSDTIVFQRQNARTSFRLTIGPSLVSKIVITPSNAVVKLGQQKQFSAQALDQYNNRVTGQTFSWYAVGGIGSIDRNTGIFTAGRTAGSGFVIAAAIVNGAVVFGDNSASASGSARVVVNSTLPEQIALHQNTPNPFNPSTEIVFDLPDDGRVRLTVYNLVGQQVAQLADQLFAAGTHLVNWDATGQPSGVYIYILESGAYRVQRKMMLLR